MSEINEYKDNDNTANEQVEEVLQPLYETKIKKRPWVVLINIFLFIATIITTTLAGVGWLNQNPFDLSNFHLGILYSVLILSVLSTHEFGHYFAAKYHNIDTTLPFYIPFPLLFLNPFGTMGAVIKMRSPITSRKALFDVGIAGPISGFIVAVVILAYGFLTLPDIEYLYLMHPEYSANGIPTSGLTFGKTLLYLLFENIFVTDPNTFVPPMNEMYHYPFLIVGWFGMLITAINLLPVGQLDGGHITYALLGKKHKTIAYIFFAFLLAMGLVGLLPWLGFNVFSEYGLLNWLIWAGLIFFFIRIEHPPLYDPEPLDLKRKLMGLVALLMFISSFTPVPVIYY